MMHEDVIVMVFHIQYAKSILLMYIYDAYILLYIHICTYVATYMYIYFADKIANIYLRICSYAYTYTLCGHFCLLMYACIESVIDCIRMYKLYT